jgi:hypothetical protein
MEGRMTSAEHQSQPLDMERQMRALRAKKTSAASLADKLAVDRTFRDKQEQIRQHKLHFFDLVSD